ncbi:MAG: beta-N-acetylhexosaminidase [Muribaculaceae bacterium]
MIRLFLFLAIMLPACLMGAQQLVPAPASYNREHGEFAMTRNVRVEANNAEAKRVADRFSRSLKQRSWLPKGSDGKVVFRLSTGLEMAPEAYSVKVSPDSVVLCAASAKGLTYAEASFLQLVDAGKGKVDACCINDSPAYGWRGFMLDESRHFFGKEKVKQYLDVMFRLKLNVFHWHLTDEPGWRIEIKRYPKLTSVGAVGNWHDATAKAQFYTQQDIREVVAYAAERGIMVVPEFDMPGHATAACRAYPELSGGGDGRWNGFTFHPSRETTFEFISNVLNELVQLFPAPYIHIGGDEVHYGNQNWYRDPEIQQFIADKKLVDERGLEHYFVRRVADIVASKGKTMIGWDEIVDAEVSPDKAVVMWWRHDRRYQLLKALERGYRVILTPRLPMYGDFVQHPSHRVGRCERTNSIDKVYNFPADIAHLFKGYESQIMGMQYSLWSERVADADRLDFMAFPRLLAVAEAAWKPIDSRNYDAFMAKLPGWLNWLDSCGIKYFNPFDPQSTPEPSAPDKQDILKQG